MTKKIPTGTFHDAEKGDPTAQYALGVWYLRNGQHRIHAEEACRWLTLAAESGHADAQAELGVQYDWPPGNEDKAYFWLQKAATQGHGIGCYFFAQYHLVDNERGTGKYSAKGAALLRRSATASIGQYPEAHLALGHCLAVGEGVERDRVEAFAWLSVAEAEGLLVSKSESWPDWKGELALLIPQMTKEELQAGKPLAAEYIQKYQVHYDRHIGE